MGCLLRSHPVYTNYARAIEDLSTRIRTEGVELELLTNTISHTTTTDETLETHALKVVTTADSNDTTLEGLIDALTDTPTKYANSTMAKFKLVSFQDTSINKDGITELIIRQNEFLHVTMMNSVVDRGTCDDTLR